VSDKRHEYLRIYKEPGLNRISDGADEEMLQFLINSHQPIAVLLH